MRIETKLRDAFLLVPGQHAPGAFDPALLRGKVDQPAMHLTIPEQGKVGRLCP